MIDSREVAMASMKTGLFGGVGYLQYIKTGTHHTHVDERPGPMKMW